MGLVSAGCQIGWEGTRRAHNLFNDLLSFQRHFPWEYMVVLKGPRVGGPKGTKYFEGSLLRGAGLG